MKNIIFLLALFLTTGCGKSENIEQICKNDDLKSDIIGEWQWTQSTGGWIALQTPENTNTSWRLNINQSNIASIYSGNIELFEEGEYCIEEEFIEQSEKTFQFINSINVTYVSDQAFRIVEDSLYLFSPGVIDAPDHTFLKLK